MKLSIKTILFGTFAIVGVLVIAQGGFRSGLLVPSTPRSKGYIRTSFRA